MKTVNCQQGSFEWLKARAGIVTCSELDNLLTPEFKVRTGETPNTYLHTKLAERIMGQPLQTGGSWEMDQGKILEVEAIPFYEFTFSRSVKRVGFVTTDDGAFGCSPDGLIGEDGGIEIKSPSPHTHVGYLLGGVMPKKYAVQVHGAMAVTGRAWWDFVSYNRHFPPLVVRVPRDNAIYAAILEVTAAFSALLNSKESTIRSLIP